MRATAKAERSQEQPRRACDRVFSRHRQEYEVCAGGSPGILLLFFLSFLHSFFFLSLGSDVRFDRFHGWSASTPCSAEQNQVYCNSWNTVISQKQKGVTFEIIGCDVVSLQSKGQDLYASYNEMKKNSIEAPRSNCSKAVYCNSIILYIKCNI